MFNQLINVMDKILDNLYKLQSAKKNKGTLQNLLCFSIVIIYGFVFVISYVYKCNPGLTGEALYSYYQFEMIRLFHRAIAGKPYFCK